MEELLNQLESVPYLLPLAIVLLRITDVSIGTMRIVFVIRGRRLIAAMLGFFEVIVWLSAISAILSHITDWLNVVAYALGFALGNLVGMLIEAKMAVGQEAIRFISPEEGERITRTLRGKGFGVTEIVASGREGPVGLGLVVVPRKKVPKLMEVITGVDPGAVVTIEDVRHSNVVEYQRRMGGRPWRRWLKKK
ncbi:MAG: DUF2179 domain-containing protein [Gemmatimonadota bacterium]|nr:DUF2179 domain-containing protein [Gemmatimonadota bacterium]